MPEDVYCLAADTLPQAQLSVLPLSASLYQQLATDGRFLVRDEVEDDPRYRQIIPYAVVTQAERVFCVERLKGGSEARLHNRLSIGLGGHINPVDHANARDVIEAALVRELREELEIKGFRAEAVGLIHRADNAVDRVHTGVLYRVEVVDEVRVRERHKLSGEMLSWPEVVAQRERLEGWSQAALDFLTEGNSKVYF